MTVAVQKTGDQNRIVRFVTANRSMDGVLKLGKYVMLLCKVCGFSIASDG